MKAYESAGRNLEISGLEKSFVINGGCYLA
jgi:hypothetical protein